MIKHIVIGCGGPTGFVNYGILKELFLNKIWNYENIESLYGSSVGAIICIVICMKLKIEVFEPYIICRNWDKYTDFSPSKLYKSFLNKHLIDAQFISDFLKPLLYSIDLNENTTLLDLYNKTNIHLHIYTVNVNKKKLKAVDLNHITFPNLTIIKAAEMSCAIPVIFKSITHDDGFYIDGGFLNAFPLNHCIKKVSNINEILAIENNIYDINYKLTNKSTIIDIFYLLMQKIILHLNKNKNYNIPNYIFVDKSVIYDICYPSIKIWSKCLENKSIRKILINKGIEIGSEFLKTRF